MAELTINAKLENLDQVLAFVDSELEKAGCHMKDQMQIDLAVEELYVNIVHYAYPGGMGSATIQVDLAQAETAEVWITFLDEGIPFDPLAKADPDVTLTAAEREIGGLGIYIVKKSMDRMLYERKDGKNILRICKKLR